MGEEYIKSEELTDWINDWLKMDKEDHPYSKGISIPTCEILDIIKRIPKYRVNFPPEKTTGKQRKCHITGIGRLYHYQCQTTIHPVKRKIPNAMRNGNA